MRCLKFLAPLLLLLGWQVPAVAEPHYLAPPMNITMLLYRGCEEACKGFQAYLQKQRVRATFTLLDAAQDRQKVRQHIRKIRYSQTPPDLVVTWGTTVTLEALGRWDQDGERPLPADIPVVFMVVSDPVGAGILEAADKPRRNVSGSLYLLPMDTQLKAARSYMHFQHIGYLLNKSESNSVSTLSQLQEQARKMHFKLEVAELPLLRSGKPDASKIPGLIRKMSKAGIDMLYQGPDTFLNIRSDLVTETALREGIPVFAAAESPVIRSSALFGVVNHYSDVGQYTAEKALEILLGDTPPEQVPVTLPRKFSYLINLPVALQLKRYPPIQLLDIAEITGLDSEN